MRKFLPIAISIGIAQMIGIVGSLFTIQSVDTWYEMLIKPPWNPPSWIFSPVWLLLYTLMGTAAYLVWTKRHEQRVLPALSVYGIQLILNAVWSFLFFGQQNIEVAFYEICALYLFIVFTYMAFWNISRRAGLLLLPYLAWVLFASVLNYNIWQLNY